MLGAERARREENYVDIGYNDEHNSAMDEIRKRIKSDEVDKTVNVEKQNRHIRGTCEYTDGRSYLFDDVDAQELVNRYHGTGRAERAKPGMWTNRETITADRSIGVKVDPDTHVETTTNRFTIHYSNTGTHVVPAKPI